MIWFCDIGVIVILTCNNGLLYPKNMPTYFQQLLAYDHWGNLRVLDALKNLPDVHAESIPARLFSHIITAEEIWLARVLDRPYQGALFWPTLDPTSWLDRAATIHDQWYTFVGSPTTDLDAMYAYYNSKGEACETPLRDIVTHLIIHGQHHRAQIAVHLRAMGQVPPATDYIYFTRDAEASLGDPSG